MLHIFPVRLTADKFWMLLLIPKASHKHTLFFISGMGACFILVITKTFWFWLLLCHIMFTVSPDQPDQQLFVKTCSFSIWCQQDISNQLGQEQQHPPKTSVWKISQLNRLIGNSWWYQDAVVKAASSKRLSHSSMVHHFLKQVLEEFVKPLLANTVQSCCFIYIWHTITKFWELGLSMLNINISNSFMHCPCFPFSWSPWHSQGIEAALYTYWQPWLTK